jgi:serine/threonine protein kinase
MAQLEITDIQDALDRPPGKRAFQPQLRDTELRWVNHAEIVKALSGQYLHHSSGGFAVVYHVRESSDKEAALRVWRVTPPDDAVERCELLSRFLQTRNLPFFVAQSFIPEALFVDSRYHPVIVMDWVEGKSLLAAVGEYCQGDTASLTLLADAVENMVLRMQREGIAHGDLQHDNILVRSDNTLCLVDYDSVYVPELGVRTCPVAGLAGYGHPDYLLGRKRRMLHACMDTFSGLGMIIALRAIANLPTRFSEFTTETLLFRPEDLESPDTSPVFAALRADADGELLRLVDIFVEMCRDSGRADTLLGPLLRQRHRANRAIVSRIRLPYLPDVPQPGRKAVVAAMELAAVGIDYPCL